MWSHIPSIPTLAAVIRRRLDGTPEVEASNAQERTGGAPRRRRRLQGGGAAGEAGDGGGSEGVPNMVPMDFIGLWILWGTITAVVIGFTLTQKLMKSDSFKKRFAGWKIVRAMQHSLDDMLGNDDVLHDSAMLREVLRQMGEFKEDLQLVHKQASMTDEDRKRAKENRVRETMQRQSTISLTDVISTTSTEEKEKRVTAVSVA
jgi:hypothetical protein